MAFNVGGLVGTLLTIPIAKRLGRRKMFALYFGASAAAILATFGLDMPADHAPGDVLRHRRAGVRRLRRLSVLPARAVPDPPARDRRRILLQHRPRAGIGRPVPGRRRGRAQRRHADDLLRRLRAAAGTGVRAAGSSRRATGRSATEPERAWTSSTSSHSTGRCAATSMRASRPCSITASTSSVPRCASSSSASPPTPTAATASRSRAAPTR